MGKGYRRPKKRADHFKRALSRLSFEWFWSYFGGSVPEFVLISKASSAPLKLVCNGSLWSVLGPILFTNSAPHDDILNKYDLNYIFCAHHL